MRSNPLRVLLTAPDYVLRKYLPALALQGTVRASAHVDTLRIKRLEVAAAITGNTRGIGLYLASRWPGAEVFAYTLGQPESPSSTLCVKCLDWLDAHEPVRPERPIHPILRT